MTSSSRFTVHALNGCRVFLDHNRSPEFQCGAYNKNRQDSTTSAVVLYDFTSLYLASIPGPLLKIQREPGTKDITYQALLQVWRSQNSEESTSVPADGNACWCFRSRP